MGEWIAKNKKHTPISVPSWESSSNARQLKAAKALELTAGVKATAMRSAAGSPAKKPS